MRIIRIASASRCRQFSKLASVSSCRFSSLSVLSPTALARARGSVRNPVLKVCVTLSLIGLRLDVRCYFILGRPPVEFRRDRSPSGTRTVDRSGTVFGYSSDVCRCFKNSLPRRPFSLSSPDISSTRPRTHTRVRNRPNPTPRLDRNRPLCVDLPPLTSCTRKLATK